MDQSMKKKPVRSAAGKEKRTSYRAFWLKGRKRVCMQALVHEQCKLLKSNGKFKNTTICKQNPSYTQVVPHKTFVYSNVTRPLWVFFAQPDDELQCTNITIHLKKYLESLLLNQYHSMIHHSLANWRHPMKSFLSFYSAPSRHLMCRSLHDEFGHHPQLSSSKAQGTGYCFLC